MIAVKNLTYQYPNADSLAVSGVDFTIAQGEIFGFLGPSGAGKSTTQKILFKLLNGYQGNVQIDNTEVSEWDYNLYQRIGVGFELPNHYLKLTALENLEFFKGFYNAKNAYNPMKLLDMVGLKSDADKKVSDFSKGMKMRLNFIRSFMHNPEILFLDEPTSGLDPANARVIKDIILDLKSKGKTIFITTHQMYDADELCDRVSFMVGGKLVTTDTPSNLKLEYSSRELEVQFNTEAGSKIFPLDGLGDNQEFLKLLKDNKVETMHSKEATLEDIFIKVTGKSLT